VNSRQSTTALGGNASPAARRYAVVIDKQPGVRVVFSTGLDRAEAELLAARLATIDCKARAVPAADGDVPGLQRRRRSIEPA
jgi:hypothetical protein